LHLLALHEVDSVPPAILQAFQESYASTAFRCRFPNCDRLSLGFATAELRLEHEVVHSQRVYCQTVSCQYSRIGFAKRSALNAHTRKHHVQSDILRIPAKVRRATTIEAEIEAEPQQQDMQQSQRQDDGMINRFAKRLMDSCKREIREKFQSDVAKWSDDRKRQLLSQGIDPLFFRFRQHAEMLYKRDSLDQQVEPNAGTRDLMLNQFGVPQRQHQGFDSNAISSAEEHSEAMRRTYEMHTSNSSAYASPSNQPQEGLDDYRPYDSDLRVEPQVSYASLEPDPYMQIQDSFEQRRSAPLVNAPTDSPSPPDPFFFGPDHGPSTSSHLNAPTDSPSTSDPFFFGPDYGPSTWSRLNPIIMDSNQHRDIGPFQDQHTHVVQTSQSDRIPTWQLQVPVDETASANMHRRLPSISTIVDHGPIRSTSPNPDYNDFFSRVRSVEG
jgi:hypothetical protein